MPGKKKRSHTQAQRLASCRNNILRNAAALQSALLRLQREEIGRGEDQAVEECLTIVGTQITNIKQFWS